MLQLKNIYFSRCIDLIKVFLTSFIKWSSGVRLGDICVDSYRVELYDLEDFR